MLTRLPFIAAVLLLSVHGSWSQNTVGLLTHDASQAAGGFTLFYPANHSTVYLIDECGRVVNRWSDTVYTSSHAVYLMENGDLVRCGKSAGQINPVIAPGGAGEMVDRRTWNGDLVWRYTYNTPTLRMHHDVEVLANGNVLIIAWELKTLAEAAALGMDTASFEPSSVWPDHLIEVQLTTGGEGTIVWEWHGWDHLVQDFDPELPNFGVVADHPERIDINYQPNGTADWFHLNSVDHNAELDQIIVSNPFFNEVWVIDHSTTSAEAATSSGGLSGKGGDLLYRWGNPEAYGRGTAADKKLFFQHTAEWIGPGLPENDSDRGKIIVYNNRVGGDHSAVDIFVPPMDADGNYVIEEGLPFGPADVEQRFTSPDPQDMYSTGYSGGQKLANGNILVSSGRQGWIFELTPDGEVVWEYIIPIESGAPVAQGTVITGPPFFKAIRYPLDHPFLSTIEPPVSSYIELEPDTLFCGSLTVGVEGAEAPSRLELFPNPAHAFVVVGDHSGLPIRVTDLAGKAVLEQRGNMSGRIDVSALAAGLYVVHVAGHRGALLMIAER